jgi:DNA-binding CsgD family transcriptional regulator
VSSRSGGCTPAHLGPSGVPGTIGGPGSSYRNHFWSRRSRQPTPIGTPPDKQGAGCAIARRHHKRIAYRNNGLRGSAATSAARAARLAETCGGADTPALRLAAQPSLLTGREREVVALVALGLSNRQIAERLTLSVRTVEGHLCHAMAKTGAANRAELGKTLTGD